MATADPHDVMHPSPGGENAPHRLSTSSHHPLWSRRHSFRTSGLRVGALTTADHIPRLDARHSERAGTPFERVAHRLARALGAWLLASGLLFGAAARADVVTDWTAVMEETTLRVPDPALPIRAAAIMQLAVFEAVNAIVGDYEPYLGSISAPAGASPEAAAIAAAHRVLERMFGADGHAITLTSPLVPDIVLHYTNWKQITDDIDDARIYGGVHYRFDQEEAARQGRKVGRYVLWHWLRPVHRHGDETIAAHEQLQDYEEDSRDAD